MEIGSLAIGDRKYAGYSGIKINGYGLTFGEFLGRAFLWEVLSVHPLPKQINRASADAVELCRLDQRFHP